MTILLLTQPQPPEAIAAHIRRLAPALEVACDPDTVAAGAVRCLVAYRVGAGVLARYPQLALLCAASSGVDKLLSAPELAERPALPLIRVVDADQARQIAQYVCGHAIAHVRRFGQYAAQQQARQWLRHAPPAFGTARASVLGLGGTGRAIAEMLRAVGFDVWGWSRTPCTLSGITTCSGTAGLADCLARSDVLVCALPLTADTANLLNRRRLEQLPPGSLLINVGRGEIVAEADLAPLLASGQLGAAVLDVHRQEPLPADALSWGLPGVLVTPHVASQPSALAVAQTVVEGMRRLQAGLPKPNAVDRVRGY